MKVRELTDYSPPSLLFNRHLETVFPALIRKVPGINYTRERINTPDNDFLDLDWAIQDSKRLVIISHGLEGNSYRAYVKGMARAFFDQGYDVLAWNYRGCSEEMNRQLRFYHSGATDDLGTVVDHALTKKYEEIYLVGFSLGGNLTLKYLGEKQSNLDSHIKKSIVFSVPLDLHASCKTISQYWAYSQRFIKSLKNKVIKKAQMRPELSIKGIDKINSLIDFDEAYTAPLHYFKSAIDYYQRCSSIHFVSGIRIPTMIINAGNDPFLDHSINSSAILRENSFLHFRVPERGGHVGFALFNQNGLYWSELQALDFFNQANV